MRGVTPSGVTLPRGETSVRLLPIVRPRIGGEPRADGDAVATRRNSSSVPSLTLLAMPRTCGRSCVADAAHQRRRSTCSAPLASAWPSISGIAETTPGTSAMRVGDLGVVGELGVHRLQDEVAVEAEDLVDELGAEAVHHRHDDDQRRDAEHDAEEGEAGDDRDEGLAPARAQIAPGDHPFEAGERPGAGRQLPCRRRSPRRRRAQPATSRLTAASSDSVSRSPVARRLISTSPRSTPFGPTITCQGRPIRSIVANFAPARWSTSS